ncbi:MAG: DinB family protein [Candidatus Dormibacterales bacterium]
MLTDEGPSPEEVVVLLASAPERALDLVGGMDEAALSYRHGPAFPTVQEAADHLARSGIASDAMIRRVYVDGQPELAAPAIHPDTSPAADALRDVTETLQDAGRSRRRAADLMRGMREEDWARSVVEPELGELSLLDLCRRIAAHEMGHLSQLRNLIALVPEHEDSVPVLPG